MITENSKLVVTHQLIQDSEFTQKFNRNVKIDNIDGKELIQIILSILLICYDKKQLRYIHKNFFKLLDEVKEPE